MESLCAGRLASPRCPISTLFIVSTTRFQASKHKNPSQVDDDCFIISQEAKQSNGTFSIFPTQLTGLNATRQISLGKSSKDFPFTNWLALRSNQLTWEAVSSVYLGSELIHKSDEVKNCSLPLQCAPLLARAREVKWICLSRKFILPLKMVIQ